MKVSDWGTVVDPKEHTFIFLTFFILWLEDEASQPEKSSKLLVDVKQTNA